MFPWRLWMTGSQSKTAANIAGKAIGKCYFREAERYYSSIRILSSVNRINFKHHLILKSWSLLPREIPNRVQMQLLRSSWLRAESLLIGFHLLLSSPLPVVSTSKIAAVFCSGSSFLATAGIEDSWAFPLQGAITLGAGGGLFSSTPSCHANSSPDALRP